MTAVRWGQSSSGKCFLASCGEDGGVRVWDAEAGACVHAFNEHDSVSGACRHGRRPLLLPLARLLGGARHGTGPPGYASCGQLASSLTPSAAAGGAMAKES